MFGRIRSELGEVLRRLAEQKESRIEEQEDRRIDQLNLM
jgi:hypothetical protein